jgi:ribosomal protein S18 acetylase RimI-like enzyme
MARSSGELYRLRQQDIPRAAAVLADAFRHDPLWLKVFAGANRFEERYRAFFEMPLRLGIRYGSGIAVSANLEGLAVWLPDRYAEMTMWRVIRCGAIGCGFRVGMQVARRMSPVAQALPRDRRAHMGETPYNYLMVIGVGTAFQGKGHGGALLEAVIEQSVRENRALYLETESEENVRFYEKRGLRVLKQITLRRLDLPMWQMVHDRVPSV